MNLFETSAGGSGLVRICQWEFHLPHNLHLKFKQMLARVDKLVQKVTVSYFVFVCYGIITLIPHSKRAVF